METSLLSASNMAVVGITTVFVALVLLIGAVSLLGLLLRQTGDSPVLTERTASPATTSSATEESPEDAYRLVALAAYAYHLRCSVKVAQPRSPSPWLRAGRQQQVQRGRGT